MSLSPKLGKLLREAREKKKLTIQDVHREIKISTRFVEAMEQENYSIFPAETYLIGFLTQYARFLNLNIEELIAIYRNDKMDASVSPVEELIKKPKWYQLGFIRLRDSWPKFLLASMVLFVFGGVFVASTKWNMMAWWQTVRDVATPDENASFCQDGEKQVHAITLPSSSSPPRSEALSLNPPDALRFSLDRLYFKLCIYEIKTDRQSNVKASVLHMNINDQENLAFELKERETYVVRKSLGLRSRMQHLIKFTPLVIGDYSIRLELETEEIAASDGDPTKLTAQQRGEGVASIPLSQSEDAEGVNIQITLRFTEESYLEWVQDGQNHLGRIVSAGEVRTFEAQDRLDIKVGNGRGVTLYRGGAKPRVLGPSGHIVHLNYERLPDPLDSSIFRIRENITVIR